MRSDSKKCVCEDLYAKKQAEVENRFSDEQCKPAAARGWKYYANRGLADGYEVF